MFLGPPTYSQFSFFFIAEYVPLICSFQPQIFRCKCSYHLTSKMLLFIAKGEYHSTIPGIHKETQCRDQWILGSPAQQTHFHHRSCISGSENAKERGGRNCEAKIPTGLLWSSLSQKWLHTYAQNNGNINRCANVEGIHFT